MARTTSTPPRPTLRAIRAGAVVSACAIASVLLCMLPQQAEALPDIPAKRFQPATSCTCHGQQRDEWALSMHAKALYDPVYVVKKQEANKATGGSLGTFCDTCHTPIGTMAGQTKGESKLSPQSKEGVTCDFCHQVTGTKKPIRNASQKLRANGTKRAQYPDSSAPTHKNAFSKFHTSAEFCGACHTLKHPTTGVMLDTTYPEWKAGPYAALGIVCQDCHMSARPGGGPTVGRAAPMGPIRNFVYLMNFVGANVPLGNAPRARMNLKAAARVSLEASDVVEPGTTGSVKVTVANVGAGHYIPAGVAEIRQMWLEVNAVSPDGAKRLLGRRQFGTVYRDAEGRYPVQLWDAVAVQSDDRIPPKNAVHSTYAFPMTTEGGVAVEAVLNYKSFPEEMAKKARVENPVTEMARAQKVVYGSKQAKRRAERGASVSTSQLLAGAAALLGALIVAGVVFALVRRRRRRKVRTVPEYFGGDRTR